MTLTRKEVERWPEAVTMNGSAHSTKVEVLALFDKLDTQADALRLAREALTEALAMESGAVHATAREEDCAECKRKKRYEAALAALDRQGAPRELPGTHLRPDGKPCPYLAEGVCNKCGAVDVGAPAERLYRKGRCDVCAKSNPTLEVCDDCLREEAQRALAGLYTRADLSRILELYDTRPEMTVDAILAAITKERPSSEPGFFGPRECGCPPEGFHRDECPESHESLRMETAALKAKR